jgi:class 3 adenylate cyclase/tetratricopeptide (TPR) repeat protein
MSSSPSRPSPAIRSRGHTEPRAPHRKARSPKEPNLLTAIRRTVTVVQSDLKGSTALGERLDAESLREVLTRYFDEMRLVFESHGGTIEKIIGDAIIAVFGLPEAQDDDPRRAVAATAESLRVLSMLNDQLEQAWGVRLITRTGVATGEVVVGEATAGQHVLTGSALSMAGAMEQNAPALEALLAGSTYELVRDHVEVEPIGPIVPKGGSEGIEAYRLISSEALPPRPEGATAALAAAAQESRKTVTIFFADPKPASLTETAPSPEALRDVMSRYFEESRRILASHGGTVEKFIGDAVMAVFGLPVRHEDDALRAVRAAAEVQRALPKLDAALRREWGVSINNHVGVNTGEVIAGGTADGQRLVTGDAVNVAARLEQNAEAGEVLIGDLTHRLVRDAVEVEAVEPLTLKGKAEPVPAYRLLGIKTGTGIGRRRDTPMVGREVELERLDAAFKDAVAAQACRVVTLVGDAGVGKTRLTLEALERARAEARVLKGRCLPYGDGITFWPIMEVVREAAGIKDEDSRRQARSKIARLVGPANQTVIDRIVSIVGLSTTTFPIGELFWGIRRFFEILATDQPVFVLFDDIHWAEQTFLDLIGNLAGGVEGAPVTLLCTARHELLERVEDWGTGSNQSRIILEPLSDADAERVVENLLGQVGLAGDVRVAIVRAAEGNPLFVEQLLSMLIDNGRLTLVGGRWQAVGDVADVTIPPTIHALLAARLDSLPREERRVIEPASVIGLGFVVPAVEAIVEFEDRPEVRPRLGILSGRQLVRPGAAGSDDDAYRFQHLLIRDAAYAGLLKRARAVLHERFVRWADVVNAERGRAMEFEEILGYHLEQAHRYLGELGTLDPHAIELGIDASARLSSAGRRAFERGDLHAASSLLRRAAAVVPTDHATRPRLLLESGEASMEMGQFNTAQEIFEAAGQAAVAVNDRGLELMASLERLHLEYLVGSIGPEDILQQVSRISDELASIGEEEGLARAYRLVGNVQVAAAHWAAFENAILALIEHAKRSGNRVMAKRSLPNLAVVGVYGPTPVSEGITRSEEVLAEVAGDRRAEATTIRLLARLRAMSGDFDRARDEYRQARRTLEELGWNFDAAMTSIESGPIELLAGDPAAAEAELRRDYEALDAMGDRNYISTVAAYLAEAVLRQGRDDEAEALATFSASTAAPDDLGTQVLWRNAQATISARRGEVENAERLAREAVSLAETSDDITTLGDALANLAAVLGLAGRHAEAEETLAQAIALYERKGNLAAIRLARERAVILGLATV